MGSSSCEVEQAIGLGLRNELRPYSKGYGLKAICGLIVQPLAIANRCAGI